MRIKKVTKNSPEKSHVKNITKTLLQLIFPGSFLEKKFPKNE